MEEDENFNDSNSEEVEEGQEGAEGYSRARLPKKGEFIGIITQRFGGNRMEVKTTDGKLRNCRVPGRYRRSLWLREGDFVIIVPWGDDKKGDIVYKYNSSSINYLKKKGFLDNLKEDF